MACHSGNPYKASDLYMFLPIFGQPITGPGKTLNEYGDLKISHSYYLFSQIITLSTPIFIFVLILCIVILLYAAFQRSVNLRVFTHHGTERVKKN